MDVSVDSFRDIEFREKKHGYHPDDVDQFVDRTVEALETLHRELDDVRRRLVEAERNATSDAVTTTEDTLKRTLVLAQRTADAAVEEAERKSTELVGQAEARAQSLIDDAERKARRIAYESQDQIRQEVATLEAARTQLSGDAESLKRYVENERNRFRTTLADALHLLDDAAEAKNPVPPLQPVEVPSSSVFDVDMPSATAPEPDSVVDVSSDVSDRQDSAPNDSVHDDEDDKQAYEGDDDDPYFADLRKAMHDSEPLGPRD